MLVNLGLIDTAVHNATVHREDFCKQGLFVTPWHPALCVAQGMRALTLVTFVTERPDQV